MGRSTEFGNHTDRAVRVVILAQELSTVMMHDSYIGPEHLLLGLLHAEPDAVQTALGVWPEEVRVAIMRFAAPGPPNRSESMPFTPGALDALKAAQRIAQELHYDHVGIKHLLFGVLSVHGDRLDQALADAGADRGSAQTRVMAALTRGRSAGQGGATGSDTPPTPG
ncbi:Clp protease N-terminal domain-containing protein [Arthrobacter sp. A2-55]|uniref:Clp protease N-terminal domain-containing protein n=1 Tax=Arthrobacter sp. A2-55 TaxID=2897337 RepID=UPI0021CD689D|nr:Clp protease N-terminal domain-containing protein [Arthrobacter sp. A2-55]MCU6481417.1 hypothetical protein [Arthrobacter sp. A2-55]